MRAARRNHHRETDWHLRVVLLRLWGFSLKEIGYAAARAEGWDKPYDHASILYHLNDECKCGKPVKWNIDGLRRYWASQPKPSKQITHCGNIVG